MAHEYNSFDHSDSRMQPPPDNDTFEAQKQRHRSPSNSQSGLMMPDANRYAPPQKPIDEAVTSAFDRAETSHYVPPDLIAQITQNVIKQLQTGGLDSGTPLPPTQTSFPPPPPPPQPPSVHQPVPQSPSTASGTSPNMLNRVYTPPSPHKHPDYPNHTSPQSQSGYLPDPPQSPTKEQKTTSFSPRRPSSPLSQSSEISEKGHARPKGPARLSTGKEETTLERIWGQLFDEEGHPTVRLGQFLRGLAVHIIEDYAPQHSIVITPNKMVKYYEDVKLSNEIYPWSTVFDDEHSSISRMYRDLECQHHLVQERFDERPDIPGLTPVGFERWVTLLIQAHPEAEFERLQKAVLEMPISNPDDKKERFPKEISRRLFPGHEDRRTRTRIETSIAEHAAVEIPRRTSLESFRSQQESPPHRPNVAEPAYAPQGHPSSSSFGDPNTNSAASSTYIPSNLERERKPYSTIPSEGVVDDTNPPSVPPSTNPIERERKPYSALPGGGKQFEEERPRDATKPRSESFVVPALKPSRSDSTARARPISINPAGQRPMEMPKPEIHHHHRVPSHAGRRHRSPSFSRGTTSDFRRSDSDIRGYQPNFEPSSVPRSDAVFDESDTRRYFDRQARERAERAKRQAEDDARSYGESPRRGHDDRAGPRRGDYVNDDDYYRAGGRGDRGNGYDYQQPYGGPVYR